MDTPDVMQAIAIHVGMLCTYEAGQLISVNNHPSITLVQHFSNRTYICNLDVHTYGVVHFKLERLQIRTARLH